MSKRRKARQARDKPTVNSQDARQLLALIAGDDLCVPGYTRLSDNPEIQTACLRIAELIGSMTIYLMQNTEDGDKRVQNGFSRVLDITPEKGMTRTNWLITNVMNMLLYGRGNAVCVPHTWSGLLQSMEPIPADRVSFMPVGNSTRDYRVLIDGQPRDPEDVLHFVYNPDPLYHWKGQGVTVTLRDIANNLKQAQKTENAFMSSEWKPSIIVKVDALAEEFSGPAGRQKLLDDYIKPAQPGQPWLIPAEQFQVEQIRPLSLSDLAIKDTVQLDKRTVAAVIGVPPFLLGVGSFNRDEYNNFLQTKVRSIAQIIQQEMTRCLIYAPDYYITLNVWSLLDYDMPRMSQVLLSGADRGFVNGDEWRERMHLPPAGLKEYKILENYIPYDKSGDQAKLTGGDGDTGTGSSGEEGGSDEGSA